MSNRTALSYWFPILESAGLPVPKTEILSITPEAREAMFGLFAGEEVGDTSEFFSDIDLAAQKTGGYPSFLRTDHTSAKHSWSRSCDLRSADLIGAAVSEIILYSEMAGFPGLPWEVWAVRERLPVIPYGVCVGFSDMPICREYRVFVDGGDIECFHPYWPEYALDQGRASFFDGRSVEQLNSLDDIDPVLALAKASGAALGGRWSVDVLETERGWYVTDLAEADKSFHWEGCPVDLARAG